MHRFVPVALILAAAWLIGGEAGGPRPASIPRLSQHHIDALNGMEPNDQAQMLLERALNQYEGALEEISSRLPGWAGQLKSTEELERLLSAAYNHNDLRIREAAIDLTLAAHHYDVTAATADRVRLELEMAKGSKAWPLWTLGLLAHKGVDPERALDVLVRHTTDRDENTRYWAVEALAYMGTAGVVEPLLRIMHDDPSANIRERAACGLAQSGMLTTELRKLAVPALLRYTDDTSLDEQTRKWAFQALRDITGQLLPEDPTTWRNWHAGS